MLERTAFIPAQLPGRGCRRHYCFFRWKLLLSREAALCGGQLGDVCPWLGMRIGARVLYAAPDMPSEEECTPTYVPGLRT